MTRSVRLAIAAFTSLVFGALTWWLQNPAAGLLAKDFTWPWRGARAILAGLDPYQTIQPTGNFPFDAPFMYPLTTALAAIPLSPLDAYTANIVFVAISTGALAFGLTARSPYPLTAFASAPAYVGITMAQSVPLLTAVAATGVPALAFLYLMKPTIGLALFAYRPTRSAAISCIAFLLLSLMIQPTWPLQWLETVRESPTKAAYFSPLRVGFAPLLLLAVTRWRRPEARLLIVLSCVPQTFYFYDQLPLLLVARSRLQFLLLGLGSFIAMLLSDFFSRPRGYIVQSEICAPWIIGTMFFPCLAFVLTRPNSGDIPAWMENFTSRFPPWLRGRSEERVVTVA